MIKQFLKHVGLLVPEIKTLVLHRRQLISENEGLRQKLTHIEHSAKNLSSLQLQELDATDYELVLQPFGRTPYKQILADLLQK